MSDARDRRLEALLVVGILLTLAVVATYPLIRHLGNALPGDLGDPLLNAWTLGWDADRLRHGLRAFWHAPILYPARYTLAYSESLLGIGLFVAPVIWLTDNAVLAHNIAFLLSYVLAGAGMYLLARSLTGRRDAALIAAMIAAFSPLRASHLSHLQVLASGWMPIALWALHRYFATTSIRILAVFVAAFTLEAWSNAYFLYFLAIPVIAVVVHELAPRFASGAVPRKLVAQLAAAAAVILAAIASMIVAYVAVRHLYGFRRGYGDWRMFSADLQSYVSVSNNVWFWRDWLSGDQAPERQLFPGLIAVGLSAVALWPARKRSGVTLLYATIGIVALLVSLGPEPRAWGHRLPIPGLQLWLTRIVPGMDGIRAPARLAVVVLLATSVLAAFGAARLFARMTRGASVAAIAIAAGIFVEGWAVPVHLAAFEAKGRPPDRRLYRWLAREPDGAVLELPIYDWSIAPTLTYQYATLMHHHPIVNGYSGYGTALQALLGGSASPLRELDKMDDALAMLRGLGIRYVLVHPGDYENREFGAATLATIRASTSEVIGEQRFDAAAAFRVRDDDVPPTLPVRSGAHIDPRTLKLTASDSAERLPMLVDGDPATRWLSGRPQAGNEWIRIELDRPRDIARVVLMMESRSLGDYPRELTVERSDSDPALLYQGTVLAVYGRSIASATREGGRPEIAVDVPANLTRILTIKQTGNSRRWWSIHELQLWERMSRQ